MRVAILHDWLWGMRGGERCLEVFCELFPDADIYTTFHDRGGVSETINERVVAVSRLQHLPAVKRYYRHLLPLYPFAARSIARTLARRSGRLPGGSYDLVLSVSHCLAKNIPLPPRSFHLSYCLTPMRYIWDQYPMYFANRPYEPLVRPVAARLRRWDRASAPNVTQYVAISNFVRERIRAVYGRPAEVIYPPVRTSWIRPRDAGDQGEGFLCASALVPYKNVELIVRSFNRLGYPLTVLGRGPELSKLRRLARSNIRFIAHLSDEQLAELYRRSKALLFAAEEDFGMIPVEMQAAGRPVICYGRGGALETVRAEGPERTGMFFNELSEEAVCEAVEDFLVRQEELSVDNCVEQAKKFSHAAFCARFAELLERHGFGAARQLSDAVPRLEPVPRRRSPC